MAEKKKIWWLYGGLLGLLFPLYIIIYGFSTDEFGPFVFMLYALLAVPFSFAFGASIGNFAQGFSSPETSYGFYKKWTIFSGIFSFLPLLILGMAWPSERGLFDFLLDYYSNTFLFPVHIYFVIFIISFYRIRTYENNSDKIH